MGYRVATVLDGVQECHSSGWGTEYRNATVLDGGAKLKPAAPRGRKPSNRGGGARQLGGGNPTTGGGDPVTRGRGPSKMIFCFSSTTLVTSQIV